MLAPQAPSWFVRKLRETHPALRVHHTGGPWGWQVSQMIPYIKNYGHWDGGYLREVKYREEKIIYAPELGSKILVELSRCWAPKYKNFDDFVKQMNIQTQK